MRSGRYEAAIATIVAVLAVAVSAYTAYIQRQQVRAQVWPILEINSGNEPELRIWIANKGVGPALIRHVRVDLEGKPIQKWSALLTELYGPGTYSYAQNQIVGRVLAAGEVLPAFVPRFTASQHDLWQRFNSDRFRVGMEICYCSTLGDCWRIVSPPRQPSKTSDVPRCPQPDATSFQE